MYVHNETYEKKFIIRGKIRLLMDFCILKGSAKKQIESVYNILATCNSEVQMDQKIHNMLHGKETLKDFINRHNSLKI